MEAGDPETNAKHPLVRPHYQFSMASLLILTTSLCFWFAVEVRPAYERDGNAGLIAAAVSLCWLLPTVLGWWKMFEKAGLPGWGAVVPIYNFVLLLRVARLPVWLLFLILFPVVNLIAYVAVNLRIARYFGKSALFSVGLMLLGFIFYPILGFGAAEYQKPTYIRYHGGEPYAC